MSHALKPAEVGAPIATPVPTAEKVFLGCLFLPIALAFVLFAIGGVGIIVSAIAGAGPLAKMPLPMTVMSVLVYGALTWFFGGIARRLFAGMRGLPVPSLIPPFIGPIMVGSLAVTCLALGVAGFIGEHSAADQNNAGRALALGVLCSSYVLARARSFFTSRRRDAT